MPIREKVSLYKQLVFEVFSEIFAITPNENGIERQLIADMERGHFVLFSLGWYQEYHREYIPFLHVDVKDTGKVSFIYKNYFFVCKLILS